MKVQEHQRLSLNECIKRQSKSMTEQIREQSDAGLTLTESLMKVRGDDWPGVHSDEFCHSDGWGDDLSLQRTGSNSSSISNWLHGQQPDSVAHLWMWQHTVCIRVKRTSNEKRAKETRERAAIKPGKPEKHLQRGKSLSFRAAVNISYW